MNKHQQKFYLRTSEFDLKSRQHPSSVLDLFQEVAGCHANKLGCGFDEMIKKDLLWMVSRIKYTVLEDTAPRTNVRVNTWPLPPARVIFQREYVITDENDKPLIIGSSEWVPVDCNTRRFGAAKDVYPYELEFLTNKNYEGRLPRLHDFETEGESYTVTPGFSTIDTNGHVNNTKYANFVLNSIGLEDNEVISDFQIDYHKEVQCGQPLTVFAKKEDNLILAKGVDENGDKMFLCQIELKK